MALNVLSKLKILLSNLLISLNYFMVGNMLGEFTRKTTKGFQKMLHCFLSTVVCYLRANVCNFRESVDSREFLNFFIFCSNNLYSTLISKIALKLVTAFYFFRNQAKFEKL